MAPAQVVRWVKQSYPKPVVNTEWLDSCCEWIATEMNLNPNTQTEAFLSEVENQLLESDLRDSMEPNTGLPRNASSMKNTRIRGSSILVEVTSIMEIGHSAFNLFNVRQAKLERADLAGLANNEEGAENEGQGGDGGGGDEGPIPSYPRSMLRLEVSDGSVTMPAIEYRSIPQLKLEETSLGFKMLLKDVMIRKGILFLEPQGIVLKGHKNNDRDELREREFLRGLCQRMMKPVPNDEGPTNENENENHLPPQAAHPVQAMAAQAQVRSPLREISEPPERRADGMDVDDADLPRKRRIPGSSSTVTQNAQTQPHPSVPSSSSSKTLVASNFFGSGPGSASSSGSTTAGNGNIRRLARVLSPARGDPIDIITDSSMEDPGPSYAPSGSSSRSAVATGKLPFPSSNLEPGSRLGTGLGSGTLRRKISYEEFEFDDDDAEMDAAFLDEIEKVEKAALEGGKKNQARGTTVEQAGKESQERTSSNGTSTRSSNSLHPRSQARIRSQTQTRATPAVITQEVITIEDDDKENEEYDKENVPVPQRRVRRRVSEVVSYDNVIDISD